VVYWCRTMSFISVISELSFSAWVSRRVQVFLSDPSTPRSSFRPVSIRSHLSSIVSCVLSPLRLSKAVETRYELDPEGGGTSCRWVRVAGLFRSMAVRWRGRGIWRCRSVKSHLLVHDTWGAHAASVDLRRSAWLGFTQSGRQQSLKGKRSFPRRHILKLSPVMFSVVRMSDHRSSLWASLTAGVGQL